MGNGDYDEYALEGRGRPVDLQKLRTPPLETEVYKLAHEGLVITCHDVFIRHKGGILLVKRDNLPAMGELWPIGGRLSRGVPAEDSLRNKAYKECGLHLENIKWIGVDRTLFRTAPFDHGHGTDTVNLVYSADGFGDLALDELHSRPMLVLPPRYLSLRKELHPYVQKHMDRLWSGDDPTLNPARLVLREWS